MLLVKMAFRNLWRRKFRTVLAVGAMGLSFGLTLAFVSLADGGHEQMAELGLRLEAGHVVVQSKGYREKRRLYDRVRNPDRVDAAVARLRPKALVIHRIFSVAALRSEEGMVRVDQLVASQPGRERRISQLTDRLVAGRFPEMGRREILVGFQAARKLGLRVGDPVVLSVAGLRGRRDEKVTVSGIFRTGGRRLDSRYALVPLDLGQRLLGLEGSVSQVAVYDDLEHAPALARRLRAALGDPGLEVLTWDEALPMLAQFIWLDDASMWVMLLLIFLIVAAGITNAVLMSVMERTREMGVLMALGMRPRRLVGEVLGEATLMGLLAVGVGLALGLPVHHYFAVHGLDISALLGAEGVETAGIVFSGKMYGKLAWAKVAWIAAGVVAVTVTAALYPALRVARLKPVRALRGSA